MAFGFGAVLDPRRSAADGRARVAPYRRVRWVARDQRAPFVSVTESRGLVSRVEEEVGHEVVRKRCAEGIVEVVTDCFPERDYPNAFVLAGNGWTGQIAIAVANKVAAAGYQVSLYWDPFDEPEHEVSIDSKVQKLNILPTTSDFYADFYVEGLGGIDCDEVSAQLYTKPVKQLQDSVKPILSIDCPTGWDSNSGPLPEARALNSFLKPEVLVSLGLPKTGVSLFAGDFHYLAGFGQLGSPDSSARKFLAAERGFDSDEEEEWWTRVPLYPSNKSSVLFRSNPLKPTSFSPKAQSGEIYGSSGGFNPTLAPDQKSKRVWVDPEDLEDMWEEFE